VGQQRASIRNQRFEARSVHCGRLNGQSVARRAALHDAVGQYLAQPGSQCLQRIHGGRRWLAAPQLVDQAAAADRPAGIERREDQQCAQPGAADVDGGSVIVANLERAEQRDLHIHHSASSHAG
jgi:hypothetical protein